MTKLNLIFCLWGLFLTRLVFAEIEKSEKQIKVSACLKLAKARMMNEPELVDQIASYLTQGDITKEDAYNKLASFVVLSCYSQVSFYKAADIMNLRDASKIYIDDEEKELVSFEKWDDILKSNDEGRMQQEMAELQEAMAEIKSENVVFDDFSEEPRQQRPEPNSQNAEFAGEAFQEGEKKVDFSLFGFNFTKLESSTKNAIGIGLIFLIFSAVLYGLNYIRVLNKKEPKKKKKIK